MNRRQLIKILGASFLFTYFENSVWSRAIKNFGTSNTFLPRMPLDEFVTNNRLLDALRYGVTEMKKRKPSDPLSWFYQAAIHGVTNEAIQKAINEDSNVTNVLEKNIWNQCPHNGQNSANFLPWHRAYTYHFERILRLHSGISDFSLPYWNYVGFKNEIGLDFDFETNFEERRTFPKEFGIQHLDGNLENNTSSNINPLYIEERDFYFTNFEHPNSTGLPLAILSKGAVDISKPLSSEVFFGEDEVTGLGGGIRDILPSTRGLLEKYPHDQIHRVVGGIIKDPTTGVESVGSMANPPTAAFDPIFPIHHCTVDLIWVKWACMSKKKWGKLPSDIWFNDKPWLFVDIDGSFVNEPRKNYFDHRALGVQYKYEDLSITPLSLPQINIALKESIYKFKPAMITSLANIKLQITADPNNLTTKKISIANALNLKEKINDKLISNNRRIILNFKDVKLGLIHGTGFNIYLTDNSDKEFSQNSPYFIGTVVLFAHEHFFNAMDHGHDNDHNSNNSNPQTFDITEAIKHISDYDNLTIVIQPFPLVEYKTDNTRQNNQPLLINNLEILEM